MMSFNKQNKWKYLDKLGFSTQEEVATTAMLLQCSLEP